MEAWRGEALWLGARRLQAARGPPCSVPACVSVCVCVRESSCLAALSRSLQAPGGASPFLASWGG